jgi:CBS domain-containing protein
MLKEEITHFLAGVMPFSFLSEEELRGIVEDIAIEYYPRGVKILTQNGPPSEHLAIIKKGGVKIFITSAGQEETVIDYRSEGEQFGLLSLIGGDRSRTNVEAIEDTICYLIAKEKVLTIIRQNPAANEYFLKSFFINFIDKTYEKTNRRQTGTNSADRLLYITPVK